MTTESISFGPLMIGVSGLELTADERHQLLHPSICGVSLFTRNYASPEQLRALTAEIHAIRPLIIAVDHEGGRVQRFREGFTRIPPMRTLGDCHASDPERALRLAYQIGLVIGHELLSHGVDFSFGPVLDIDHGNSSVIGHRAFHSNAGVVAALAAELQRGSHDAGMATVGKHYPGHGYARADSHVELPQDDREYSQLLASDLVPFARLAADGMECVMPAHVVYGKVDSLAAGFSPRWLQDILRGELGFAGAIMSDDLGMEAAAFMGGMTDRADAALAAGCDIILSCNDPVASAALMAHLGASSPESAARIGRLRARAPRENLDIAAATADVRAFVREVMPDEAQPDATDIVARL
ncbi:MAG: beta-N-acetylhexosaminidase [Burkholderiales bacterium]|nr:beta-N-acetylhexosaminidase [Burkholderiales bacterium]